MAFRLHPVSVTEVHVVPPSEVEMIAYPAAAKQTLVVGQLMLYRDGFAVDCCCQVVPPSAVRNTLPPALTAKQVVVTGQLTFVKTSVVLVEF
jgi:hypothetical protein